jgi:hypothetical protein
MASIKTKKEFIWYCPSCGHCYSNSKLVISNIPFPLDFYRKCKKCKKYFSINNTEIVNCIDFNDGTQGSEPIYKEKKFSMKRVKYQKI